MISVSQITLQLSPPKLKPPPLPTPRRKPQTALAMDPAHLISPPRAHPSGSANGGGIDENHQRRHHGGDVGDAGSGNGVGYVNEPWFMMLVSTMLVVVLLSTAAAAVFLRSRHTHLHHGSRSGKALGHLSGTYTLCYQMGDVMVLWWLASSIE